MCLTLLNANISSNMTFMLNVIFGQIISGLMNQLWFLKYEQMANIVSPFIKS